jgi:hypothetical protein
MVLQGQLCGRVGRRQVRIKALSINLVLFYFTKIFGFVLNFMVSS